LVLIENPTEQAGPNTTCRSPIIALASGERVYGEIAMRTESAWKYPGIDRRIYSAPLIEDYKSPSTREWAMPGGLNYNQGIALY